MSHAVLHHDHHHAADNMDIFGFWIYILSDCILFGTIFSAFAVLHTHVYGGLSLNDLTSLPTVFAETITLLTSSFTFGLAILCQYKQETKKVIVWLAITFLFGATFVGMEINEFIHLVQEGHGWQSSAAMSAFFTLVGTHGLHVTFGLLWMLVMMIQLAVFGITPVMQKRLAYLGLFWTFLDIIWIFVYTIVYLIG
ncbi:MAG: cytochrome o ubiquinol oxidase subunit III [Gammaproteobacteria bacterium]|nr:cytochrome o ubiquinol oxidase subunit III [Gammaproteobacteria bacterium]